MKLEYDDFKEKFGLWAERFKPFIESEEMYRIYERLKADSESELILPDSENTFRAFELTPPHHLKVVWYLMDPYPKLYPGKERIPQATGVAMDCSNSPNGKLQPSLEKFYDAVKKDLDRDVYRSPSLEYLCQQGVLLLNTSLTCKWRKTGSHKGVWDAFHKYFLEEVLRGTKLIYVLSGEDSWNMERFISPLGNTIMKTEHPVAASYAKRDWNHEGIFNKINKVLDEERKHVFWSYKDWEEEPPF